MKDLNLIVGECYYTNGGRNVFIVNKHDSIGYDGIYAGLSDIKRWRLDGSYVVGGSYKTKSGYNTTGVPVEQLQISRKVTKETVLLKFIASLTLCDHMGDVCDDINEVLKQLDIDIDYEDLSDLGSKLGEIGITTLQGTSMVDEL